jgi:nucleotide-binding universal stress UspA family protein
MTQPPLVRNVLFATDFSDASRLAGESAAAFARHFGARLHVLHVVPPVTDPTRAPAALRAAAAEVERGLTVVTAIASGRVVRHIADYARRNAIDLIVIGTHGRTGVSHALLGSVAEVVTRRAGCRVLTVPASLQERRCPPRRARPSRHRPRAACAPRDAGRAHLRGVPREDSGRGARAEASD